MLDALFLIAVLCGAVSAWKGNRTAWFLLGSLLLSSALIWTDVPFNVRLWLLIDLVVIGAIAARPLGVFDVLVIALFIPAWALYVSDMPHAGEWINMIVALQLVLTLPFLRLWARVKRTSIAERKGDGFDLFEARSAHVRP